MIDPSNRQFQTAFPNLATGSRVILAADGLVIPAASDQVEIGITRSPAAGGLVIIGLNNIPQMIVAPGPVRAGAWLYAGADGGYATEGKRRAVFTLEPAAAAGDRIEVLPISNSMYTESAPTPPETKHNGARPLASSDLNSIGETQMPNAESCKIYRAAFDREVEAAFQTGRFSNQRAARNHVIRSRPELVHAMNATSPRNASTRAQSALADAFKGK